MKAVLFISILALGLLPRQAVAQSTPILYNNKNVFTITNSKTSNVLDNDGSIATEGNPVEMYTPNGGSNQQWLFTNVTSNCALIQNMDALSKSITLYLKCDTNGYSVSSKGTSFKVTTDGRVSTCDGTLYLTDGAKMQSAVSDNSQVWTLNIQYYNSVFFLTSNKSSYVIDNYGGNIVEGNIVGTYQLSGSSNQQWLFTNVTNNCAMIQNVISQMYLNCNTSGCRLSAQGTSFKATADDISQIWTLNYVTTNFPPSTPLSQFNLASPIYIASLSNGNNVLDDYYGSQSEGSNVDLYQKGTNSLNQQWGVNVDPSGHCALFLNQYGNKNMYLKCNGGGCFLSSNPTLFAFSASQNQTYISTCDGSQYLTITNGHVKLQDYDANNSNQLWLPPPNQSTNANANGNSNGNGNGNSENGNVLLYGNELGIGYHFPPFEETVLYKKKVSTNMT